MSGPENNDGQRFQVIHGEAKKPIPLSEYHYAQAMLRNLSDDQLAMNLTLIKRELKRRNGGG